MLVARKCSVCMCMLLSSIRNMRVDSYDAVDDWSMSRFKYNAYTLFLLYHSSLLGTVIAVYILFCCLVFNDCRLHSFGMWLIQHGTR